MKTFLQYVILVSFGMSVFGQATLLKDINTGNGGSRPSNKIEFNSALYFVADDGIHGKELWKTDGTAVGTKMVKDIVIGPDGGFTSELKGQVLNGELLFFEQTAFNVHNLWKTDGTEVGTVLVKTLANGNILVHTDLNGELLFSLANELWKTDGTGAGTVKVSNIPVFGNRYVKSGTHLYFSGNAYDGKGNELYKTDGTGVGTVLVKDIFQGNNKNSYPTNFGVANGIIFFTAYTSTYGNELWKTDGTEMGTVLVKDVTPGTTNTFTNENPKASFNNEFFIAFGTKLWKSDGTELGTVEVKEVGAVKALEVFNSKLVAFNYNSTFWESDGTTAGTNEITTEVDEFFHNGTRTIIGNELYFQGRNECFYQLWKTDGTAIGTTLIKVINPEWDDNHIEYISSLNGDAFFTASDGQWHGNELWISDGTKLGTQMLKDINMQGNTWSNPKDFFDFNGTLLFSADNGINGRELWKSVSGVTTMVKDINSGNLFSNPSGFIEFNGDVYFKATTKDKGIELWKTDGTEGGTVRITDINTDGANGLSANGNIVLLNNKLYFFADDGTNGFELWESDGTAGGTMLVKDINTSGGSMRSGKIIVYDNALFFNADNGTDGFELWTSDGTSGGTILLKDIHPSSSGSPDNLTLFNSKLYFTANTTSGGRLWMTDGTAPGTVLVSASASYPNNLTVSGSHLFFTSGNDLWKTDGISTSQMGIGGYPNTLTDHLGTLFFSTNSGGVGYELWKTDGTASGMVKDIVQGSNKSSYINAMVSFAGYLFFGAGDNSQNRELWQSDGTELGTFIFQNINPSTEMFGNGSDPKEFFVLGNRLYFSANDGSTNVEPWVLSGNTLGSEDVVSANDMLLYPNPIKTEFRVTVHNATVKSIKVFSILGNQVLHFTANNQGVYDISNLNQGIYILNIYTEKGVITKRVIKS